MDTTKQAKALRQALKVASVSSTSSWIDALNGSGYVIAPASDVLTPERKAAIGRAADAVEAGKAAIYTDGDGRVWWACDTDEHAAEMSNITDDDLATLREMAS